MIDVDLPQHPTEHEGNLARVRRLFGQIAAARAVGDHQALEGLVDALKRAECRLTVQERNELWLESIRGVDPAPFERSKTKKAKTRKQRDDREEFDNADDE